MDIKSSIILRIISEICGHNRQLEGNAQKNNAKLYEHDGLNPLSNILMNAAHGIGIASGRPNRALVPYHQDQKNQYTVTLIEQSNILLIKLVNKYNYCVLPTFQVFHACTE